MVRQDPPDAIRISPGGPLESPGASGRRIGLVSRVALAVWLSIAAGLVKLVGLPLFLWPLRTEAALLSSERLAPALSPAWLARAARAVADGLDLFLAFWMLLGLLMIVAAAGLKRGRRWGRVGLQAICWFGVLEASGVAAFIDAVRRMLLRAEAAGGEALAASLASRFWAALAWLLVYVTILSLLRAASRGDRTHGQAQGQSPGS
jgi:hypothetical protein